MYRSRRVLLLLWTLQAFDITLQQEPCFKYIEVPPRVLDCNPYESKLKLLCNVTGPMDSSYEILWFYQGENTLDSTATCESDQSGMLTSVLEVNPSSGSFIGEFYCQIHLGNGSWLEPSQSLMQDLTEAVIQVQGFVACTSDPLSDMSDDICVGFAESTANNSIAICSFVPEPTPSLPSVTPQNSPPSDEITTTSLLASTPTPPDMETSGKSNEGDSNTAAIIGGVIGGGGLVLFGVVIMLLLLIMVAKRHRKSPILYDYVGPPEVPLQSIRTSSNVAYGNKVEVETNTASAGSIQVQNYERTDSSSDQSYKKAKTCRPNNVAYGQVTPQQPAAIYEEASAQPEKNGNVAYPYPMHEDISSHNSPRDIDVNDNVAYGQVTPQQPAAIYEEASAQVNHQKIEMSGNVAYGQISH